MAVYIEGARLSGLLKDEFSQTYNRESVTILAGSGADRELTLGTVLGRITASGKVVQLDLAGVDGSEDVYGVLLGGVTAPDGTDAPGVALVRGPAVIADTGLTYPSGATDNQKATINAELVALGIVVRQGV